MIDKTQFYNKSNISSEFSQMLTKYLLSNLASVSFLCSLYNYVVLLNFNTDLHLFQLNSIPVIHY